MGFRYFESRELQDKDVVQVPFIYQIDYARDTEARDARGNVSVVEMFSNDRM